MEEEFATWIGKVITVNTVDGKSTTGEIVKANKDLMGLAIDKDNYVVIFTRSIVSIGGQIRPD